MTEYLKMVPLPFWWQKLDLNELYHRPNLELACNVGSRLFLVFLFILSFCVFLPQKGKRSKLLKPIISSEVSMKINHDIIYSQIYAHDIVLRSISKHHQLICLNNKLHFYNRKRSRGLFSFFQLYWEENWFVSWGFFSSKEYNKTY